MSSEDDTPLAQLFMHQQGLRQEVQAAHEHSMGTPPTERMHDDNMHDDSENGVGTVPTERMHDDNENGVGVQADHLKLCQAHEVAPVHAMPLSHPLSPTMSMPLSEQLEGEDMIQDEVVQLQDRCVCVCGWWWQV